MLKKVFAVLLVLVYSTPSFQDGFNFYKALNRTPINRIERFNRDGYNRGFKVPLPLSKRLLYDELVSEKTTIPEQRSEEEFLSVFLNWFPRASKLSDLEPKEGKPKRCMDIRDVFSNLND